MYFAAIERAAFRNMGLHYWRCDDDEGTTYYARDEKPLREDTFHSLR